MPDNVGGERGGSQLSQARKLVRRLNTVSWIMYLQWKAEMIFRPALPVIIL
jgi:hypothetical protein